MHVLLLEPDRQLAETYRQYFMAAGHSVTPCASAQAAVLAADQTQPDVVVLELQLIGHSGIEFLYEFRSYGDWQTVPVVVHSHIPSYEFRSSWQSLQQQLGISYYLYKPHTSLRQLLQGVTKQLA